VFILYAIPLGIAAGYLLGGRLVGLASLDLRWTPVAIAGLVVQVLIFGPLGTMLESLGSVGPILYVGSTFAVLAAVARNVRVAGLQLVVLGAALNLVAIVANGGVMPADPGAMALQASTRNAASRTVLLWARPRSGRSPTSLPCLRLSPSRTFSASATSSSASESPSP
jgi:hypothetical protein